MWQDEEYREKQINRLKNPSLKTRKILSNNTKSQWKDPEMRLKMVKGRVLNVLNKIITEGILNENISEEYNKRKPKNTPTFENAIKKYGNGIVEEAKYYNHKVISIKRIKLEKPEPVYNLTVEKWHNYMLDNGVISRNCDADVDGSHIACLLLTFIYKYMKDLILEGHVYMAAPPLYKVVMGNDYYYLIDDEELKDFKVKNKGKKLVINRFKGLGEMNPEQLGETVLKPETRKIKQITIEDVVEVADIIERLMGSSSEPRKEFLEKNMVI